MKVIIAGCRSVKHYTLVEVAVDLADFDITEVVSGTNGIVNSQTGKVLSGTDLLGEAWAEKRGIPITRFPANWDVHGKAAGPIRNAEMASYGEALIALWDGKSAGTRSMIREACKRKLPIFVYWLRGDAMIYLTEQAAEHLERLLDLNDMTQGGIRVGVKAGGCSGLEYVLDMVEGPEEDDRIFEHRGIPIYCPPRAHLYIKGTTIDYKSNLMGGGFSFENPNAKRFCGCGTSFTV